MANFFYLNFSQGDSGGGFVHFNVVIGVASSIKTECGAGNPDSLTDVFYHKEWINGKITPDEEPLECFSCLVC